MRNIFIILFCVVSLSSIGQGNRVFYDTMKFASPITTGITIGGQQYHYSRSATDTVTSNGNEFLVVNDSATTTGLLIILPSTPVNGQKINLSSIYAVPSGVTISPTVLGTITSLTANGTWGWIYNSTLSKWIRKN